MKRFISGLFAIAIAISLIAFKTASLNPRGWAFVVFMGEPQDILEVMDERKWERVSVPPVCDGANGKACKIQIEESKLTTGSPQTLDPQFVTLNVAVGSTPDYFYVYALSSGLIGTPGSYIITNKD